MSNGYGISKRSNVSEVNSYTPVFEDEFMNDVRDVCGRLPYDALLDEEERAPIGGEDYLSKSDVVSAVLSFIFQPVRDNYTTIYEISFRCFVLAYIVNASLIDNWSLAKIGEVFGTSRQTVSARLIKMSKTTKIHCRSQKSYLAAQHYSEIGLERWRLKKLEERKEYQKAYRERHREKLLAEKREYYQKNKARLVRKAQINRAKRNLK